MSESGRRSGEQSESAGRDEKSVLRPCSNTQRRKGLLGNSDMSLWDVCNRFNKTQQKHGLITCAVTLSDFTCECAFPQTDAAFQMFYLLVMSKLNAWNHFISVFDSTSKKSQTGRTFYCCFMRKEMYFQWCPASWLLLFKPFWLFASHRRDSIRVCRPEYHRNHLETIQNTQLHSNTQTTAHNTLTS